jgi:hypothetical protein
MRCSAARRTPASLFAVLKSAPNHDNEGRIGIMTHSGDKPGRRRCASRRRLILLVSSAAVIFLYGCAVDDISVVSYNSNAEVRPSENQPAAVVGASPFPWDVVLGGASDILTGARKKAIEEKVGYRESRSFTLFRLRKADSQSERSDEKTRSVTTGARQDQEK